MLDSAPRALAVAAHPDDIEFTMSGTLCLLARAGFEIHYFALADGYAGHHTLAPEELVSIRRNESTTAADVLGAVFHDSIASDVELIYSVDLVRRVSAVVRSVQPMILLTHALDDYMEDHSETARIASTAAFNRHLPNVLSVPPTASYRGDVTVYHAQPHGLRDQMGRWIRPEMFVDISGVADVKIKAIRAHRSQEDYLAVSQGFHSMEQEMSKMEATMGRMSGVFIRAEGWRRHSHLGFCVEDSNPLLDALGSLVTMDADYAETLGRPS